MMMRIKCSFNDTRGHSGLFHSKIIENNKEVHE